MPERQNKSSFPKYLLIGVIVFLISFFVVGFFVPNTVSNMKPVASEQGDGESEGVTETEEKVLGMSTAVEGPKVVHVTTPKAVKAVYISSWVGGTKSLRDKIIAQIVATEANAVVLDIKDYTGMISYMPNDPAVLAVGCIENRIKDIDTLIAELHDKNIYVIGRVAVFQDPCAVKVWPEQAVKRKSDGGVWKDRNGITWMDAGSEKVWEYNVAIAKDAHAHGFDEINFDYIRYPSDGNMIDISFPVSGVKNKQDVLEGFFAHLDIALRGGQAIGATRNNQKTATNTVQYYPAKDPAFDKLVSDYGLGITASSARKADPALDGVRVETTIEGVPRIVTSADLFGMVTNNTDDLGIGQVLERAAPYVDFIGPMVYPSHYPKNFIGISNPAASPYQIISHAMRGGVAKLQAIELNPLKLRPWLQDFNLGATYTAEMVRQQINATYDVGLTSWMLWDASNTYTPGGMLSI